jgi:hypothetical protein
MAVAGAYLRTKELGWAKIILAYYFIIVQVFLEAKIKPHQQNQGS